MSPQAWHNDSHGTEQMPAEELHALRQQTQHAAVDEAEQQELSAMPE